GDINVSFVITTLAVAVHDLFGDADEILAGRQTREAIDAAIIGRHRPLRRLADAAHVLPQAPFLSAQQRDRDVDRRVAVFIADLARDRAATSRAHLHLRIAAPVHRHFIKLVAEGVEVQLVPLRVIHVEETVRREQAGALDDDEVAPGLYLRD